MTPSRRLSFLRAVGWGLCCVSVALLTFTVAFAQGPTAPPRRGPAPHRPPAPPKSAHPQPPRPHFPGRPEETIHVKKTLPLPPVREGDRPYKKTPHLDQRVGNLRFVLDRFERDDKVTCDLTVSGGKPGWTRDWTPLHEAAALGDIPGIHKALEGRIDVNASRHFLTPLHVAVILNQTDAIRLLLRKGADLRAPTFTHQGPVDLARACRHPETARLLSAFTSAQRYLEKHPRVVVRAGGTAADITDELRRIARGIKDEHQRDGSVFGNYDGHLPRKEKYYYTEFVHRVGSSRSAGPRRIVIGEDGDIWYTADHYDSFTRVDHP